MGIETDLNVSPYFDDANNAIEDNYHRILFRPAVPVQARELTQLQDILQNQIERFGDNIFTAGTIIKGCNFSFDPNYSYVKVLDLRPIDSQPVQPSSYVGLLAREASSNLYAICYNYQDGFESQDPDLKTLYFKYLNSGTSGQSQFSPGEQLNFYETTEISAANSSTAVANADVKIASSNSSVGKGYAMSVSSGVIFQKGHFVQVPSTETVIVEKYSTYPDNKVAGFLIDENIITELQDPNLLDNATGYSNLNAPGAHRLQLLPTLTVFDADTAPTNNFFSLVEWQNGNIVKSFQETQYSVIGNEMARRTYEESGNFVVRPFRVTMKEGNTTHNFAIVSSGLAYIDGHRVEQLNNIEVPIRKGTDTRISTNQTIQTNFDHSILVGEYVGNIPTHVGATISLRDAPGLKISNNQYANGTPAGNEIGTAKTMAFHYQSGTVGAHNCLWKCFLTDIKMNLGKNFKDVKAIHYNGGSAGNAHADVARSLDVTTNSYVSSVIGSSRSSLVFNSRKRGLVSLSQGPVLPKYIYRTVSNTTIDSATGQSSLIELSNTTVYPYGVGALTPPELSSLVVIPTGFTGGATYANVTLTKSGNLVVTSGSANVIANSSTTTNFVTEYEVGDWLAAANTIRRIVNISNSTFMTVASAYSTSNASATHRKCYPIGVPVNLLQRRSKATVTDTAAQHMRIDLLASNGAAETLTANMSISVTHNAKQPDASDRNLQANTDIVVRINTSNNAGGTTGPWSLGVPLAYVMTGAFKSSNTGTVLANTTTGNAYILCNTTGLSNLAYVTGSGIPAGATANVVNSTALLLSSAATATANNVKVKWAYFSTSANDSVLSSFTLNPGQKDAFFDLATVSLNASTAGRLNLTNGDLLTFRFSALKPQNQGVGFISCDSYTTLVGDGRLRWENIPAYMQSKTGRERFLRDAIDFRPFVVNTAAYTNSLSSSTINPVRTTTLGDVASVSPTSNTELYLPAPNQNFEHEVYHYVGRIDKLVLNSYGKYQVVEGQPSNNPVPPADVKGAMTLALINVPPFPSYVSSLKTTNVSASYVTTVAVNQNRVYTMRDIGKLDKRVENLEYYTSLSLLESKTSSLTIPSSVTGANRFKNGIFVDNFETTDMLDIQSSEYKIGLSTSESALVPRYVMEPIGLRYANGTNTVANNGIIRLAANSVSAEVAIISQASATETFRCADAIYDYTGSIVVYPKADALPDVNPGPAPVPITPPPIPQDPPKPPPGPPPSGLSAHGVGGFQTPTFQPGQPLHWYVSASGYATITVTVNGPNSYIYTEQLQPFKDLSEFGQPDSYAFSSSLTIPDPVPGTYTFSTSRVTGTGYGGTEKWNQAMAPSGGVIPIYDTALVLEAVPLATPDQRGIGTTEGLTTIIISNTVTTPLPPVTNNNITTDNNQLVLGAGGAYGIEFTYSISVGEVLNSALSGYNIDLIVQSTGTPNTTTATTSTAKSNTSNSSLVAIPGLGGGIQEPYYTNKV